MENIAKATIIVNLELGYLHYAHAYHIFQIFCMQFHFRPEKYQCILFRFGYTLSVT